MPIKKNIKALKHKNIKATLFAIIFFVIITLNFPFSPTTPAIAANIAILKAQIISKNQEAEKIQKEIDEYQKKLTGTAQEKSTLNSQLTRLELIKKKLSTDILLTQKKIESAELNLEQLAADIGDKRSEIEDRKNKLAEIFRAINEADKQSLVEVTLKNDNFSDFYDDLEQTSILQKAIDANMNELAIIKIGLENKQNEVESAKKERENYKSVLTDQKQLIVSNKTAKERLLKETKNKESNYKKILADRLAKQAALEDEIKQFEEQLRVEIDPKSLPPVGSGVLKWPVSPVKITQYFGNTTFATANPQIYSGKGHTGIDFGISEGTPVKAVKEGVIIDTGDTDTACRGVSFGKWVLIKHPNNLTTLYGHLSFIKAYKGQSVETGQTIGYSGDTGYSTGPHLHFGVYASQGIWVAGENGAKPYTSKVCKTAMKLPVASQNSYLNPLSYL